MVTRIVSLLVVSISLSLSVFCQINQPFQSSCQLPFNGEQNSFDQRCGIKGSGTDPAKIAESEAKNNFCANPQSVVRLSVADFVSLQTASDQLNSGLSDRSVLHNLIRVKNKQVGEGSDVEFIAFVLDAHYSNVSSGETVNCKIRGKDSNDIHIVLVQDPSADPCTSITAEMSPHFRPSSWTDAAVNSAAKHPIRVRGQLFFDSSHKPCRSGHPASPARQSVWEIHPTYAFDICRKTTIGECAGASEADWITLDKWTGAEEDTAATSSESATTLDSKQILTGGCTLSCPTKPDQPTVSCSASGAGATCSVISKKKLECSDANVKTTCSCGPNPSCSVN